MKKRRKGNVSNLSVFHFSSYFGLLSLCTFFTFFTLLNLSVAADPCVNGCLGTQYTASPLDSNLENFIHTLKKTVAKTDPKFQVDLSELEDGSIQSMTVFSEAKDFKQDYGYSKVLDMDTEKLTERFPSSIFMYSKSAFIVKGIPPEKFDQALFANPDFHNQVIGSLKAAKTNKPNVLSMSRTISIPVFKDVEIKFDSVVGTHNYLKDQGDIDQKAYLKSVLDFDPELGAPEHIILLRGNNGNKNINGSSILNKYYRINEKDTLIVSYSFNSSPRPFLFPMFFLENGAVKMATAEKEANVKSIRTKLPGFLNQ